MLGGNSHRKEEAQNFFGKVDKKAGMNQSDKAGQLKWSLGVQLFFGLELFDETRHSDQKN